MKFIDPDGRTIVLASELTFRQRRRIVRSLRRLTSDRVRLRSGQIQISRRKAGGQPYGTALVRRMAERTDRKTEIRARKPSRLGKKGNVTGFETKDLADAQNGIGADAVIEVDFQNRIKHPTVNPETGEAEMMDRADEIGLGHELVHADRINDGRHQDRSVGSMISATNSEGRSFTQSLPAEEAAALRGEAKLRHEGGHPQRAAYCNDTSCN